MHSATVALESVSSPWLENEELLPGRPTLVDETTNAVTPTTTNAPAAAPSTCANPGRGRRSTRHHSRAVSPGRAGSMVSVMSAPPRTLVQNWIGPASWRGRPYEIACGG